MFCEKLFLMTKKSWRQVMVVLCLNTLTACVTLTGEQQSVSKPQCCDELHQLRSKVKELEDLLVEKEALIHKQSQIQQKQIQVQKQTNDEISRTRLRLHRLATKPSTASTIAEVEVAMARLKQRQLAISDLRLKEQAQVFLDAAIQSYQKDEYTSSMNYASQAYEMINMVSDKSRVNKALIGFHVHVTLSANTGVNMRRASNSGALILLVLEKDAKLIANAYQGNWLRVQAENGEQGWVYNSLVDTRI